MVGNGGFVLAGALEEHTETGPATSASTSTFSTVASISGKSSKSVCTTKSAICYVDNTKLVGNGGFVLAGALRVRTETGPAASASDSTFSTVASISGKSLNVSKSLSTRKSAVCCVDTDHSWRPTVSPTPIQWDAIASTGKTRSPCRALMVETMQPAVFWLPLHFLLWISPDFE